MSKYHHGDLRNTLMAIATELLITKGIHTLSLRKIAQKAGVSHNAPYMHFADKEAVLAAIALEGFRLLSEEIEVAIAVAGDNIRQQLLALSHAYVKFAIAHPNHIQVMFCAYDEAKYPDLCEASQLALNRLLTIVQMGQENGSLVKGNAYEVTKSIWAMVHGIAAISIAYKTSIMLPEKNTTEDAVSAMVNLLFDGISRHSNERDM